MKVSVTVESPSPVVTEEYKSDALPSSVNVEVAAVTVRVGASLALDTVIV